jgi:uncharacterized protein (TIGR00369 family)
MSSVDSAPSLGYLTSLGLSILTSSPSLVVCELLLTQHCLQPFSLLHGGLSCSLVETVGFIGVSCHASSASIHLSSVRCSHLSSAFPGDYLLISGRSTKVGKRVVTWEVEILSAKEKFKQNQINSQAKLVARGLVNIEINKEIHQQTSVEEEEEKKLQVNKVQEYKIQPSPLGQLIGFSYLFVSSSRILIQLQVTESHQIQKQCHIIGIIGEELGSMLSGIRSSVEAAKNGTKIPQLVGTEIALQHLQAIAPGDQLIGDVQLRACNKTFHWHEFRLYKKENEKHYLIAIGSLSVMLLNKQSNLPASLSSLAKL